MKDTRKLKLRRNSSEFKQLYTILSSRAGAVQRNRQKDADELHNCDTPEVIEKYKLKGWDLDARKKQLKLNIACYDYALFILNDIAADVIGQKFEIVQ